MPSNAHQVKQALKLRVNPVKAEFLPKFFQVFPGGYGEGDQFLGVVVPDQRKVARQFRDLPRDQLDQLLQDPFHECRLTATFILVDQFDRLRDRSAKRELVNWLLQRTAGINNWDLVDTCGPRILGVYLRDERNRQLLRRLAKSKNLWEQRLAVVATMPLIKQGEFAEILELAEQFLNHPHGLIHKAVGWMLREVGNVERQVLIAFLDQYLAQMPRTMLRYSIEKIPEVQRKMYLGKKA